MHVYLAPLLWDVMSGISCKSVVDKIPSWSRKEEQARIPTTPCSEGMPTFHWTPTPQKHHSRNQVCRKCIWQPLKLKATQFSGLRQIDHRACQNTPLLLPHWALAQGQLARCPPRSMDSESSWKDTGSHLCPDSSRTGAN